MARVKGPWYPFAPLAAAMGLTECAAVTELGLWAGESRLYRTRGMSEKVADRLAVKAGFHPFTIWPSMLDDNIVKAEPTPEQRDRERRRSTLRRGVAKQQLQEQPA